jgi:hypothetical protein
MSLNKIQENGYTYFQLYISCPVCLEKGKHMPITYWQHAEGCNGDIYIGDDANYKCKKCGKKGHVKNWKYNCPGHSNSPDEFVGASCQALASAIATAGQLTTAAGVAWLQKFLANMGEW